MKWKKRIKYFVAILIVATIVIVVLANRDLTRMYGGLTKRVDTQQFQPQSGPVAINNVNILSPNGENFISGQTVYLENGLIVSIGTAPINSEQIQSINGEGKYLIPGLTDSHVHLFKSRNDLLLYVANGVTQIRELIGENDHLLWRQQIQGGQIGPDMFIASPRIGSFEFLEGKFMSWSQGFLNISNASEAETAVKKLHQQGYDAVKIYSHINKETYYAVTIIAKELGMRVVGHVPWSVEMTDIYPIQEEVSHLEELMNAMNREFGGFKAELAEEYLAYVETRSDEIADQLLKNDVAVTTTLWLVESFVRQKFELDTVLQEVELEYENPGISEWSTRVPQGLGWLPEVNRYRIPDGKTEEQNAARKTYWETYAKACQLTLNSLVKKGVKVMAGTDANLPPTVPGFSLHDELVSLNRAGMSPSDVLKAATATPSEWLGNNAGTILPGRKANLVLLNKNPLNDIGNTKAINSVILNGNVLDRALLDQILNAVKESNDSSRKMEIDQYLN